MSDQAGATSKAELREQLAEVNRDIATARRLKQQAHEAGNHVEMAKHQDDEKHLLAMQSELILQLRGGGLAPREQESRESAPATGPLRIRITSLTTSAAPEEVRRDLIGLEVGATEVRGSGRDAVAGRVHDGSFYRIDLAELIEALRAEGREFAAGWLSCWMELRKEQAIAIDVRCAAQV